MPYYCSCPSTFPSSDQDEEQQEQSPSKGHARAGEEARARTTTPTAAATNVQVFDSSWSATAVFTVSGEPLDNEFLHGNTAHVVPVQQQITVPLPPPVLLPVTSLTSELSVAGAAKAPVLFHRETAQGVGSARVPPRSRAEEECDHTKGPQEQADSVLWLGASSHCYWRAAGRNGGEGDRRRWTLTPKIPMRMARRTGVQIQTGTSTTGSGQESSWCQLLS